MWSVVNHSLRTDIENILWLHECIEKPSAPSDLKIIVPPVEYEKWLDEEAPSSFISMECMKSFMNSFTICDSQRSLDTIEALISRGSEFTFSLRPDLRVDGTQNEQVTLENKRDGLKLNSNIYKLCNEIKEKIGRRESGNGYTQSYAAKILWFQLSFMPGSGIDDNWKKKRACEISTYIENKKKHEEKFNHFLRKKRKRVDE